MLYELLINSIVNALFTNAAFASIGLAVFVAAIFMIFNRD